MFDTIYKKIARPLLFSFDPENVHDWVMDNLGWIRPLKPVLKPILSRNDPRFRQDLWGLTFSHPIGLAGGFDKNAQHTDLWEMLGFSFIEVGTVTPNPQAGNPKPRLFRYPGQQALVNRMGFNNHGSQAIARHLENARPRSAVMGISIGKQKETPADDISLVIRDYLVCLDRLHPYADYFAVNVSSPNTPDLRTLQQREPLSKLLTALTERLEELKTGEHRTPLCVKFAPDLSDDEIKEAVEVALDCGADGIIATNTTNQTGDLENGGLSGKPLRERSTQKISLIAEITGGKTPIIGCGGIFTAEDAVEKIQAGAWLLQIYTGFVYQGPKAASNILRGIQNMMNAQELDHVSQIRE